MCLGVCVCRLGDKHVGVCPGKWAGGMFSAVIICIMDFLFSKPVCPFINGFNVVLMLFSSSSFFLFS